MKKFVGVLVVLALLAAAASAMAADTTRRAHKPAPRLSGKIVKIAKDGDAVKSFDLKVPCLNGPAKIVTVAVDGDTKYMQGLRAPATVDALATDAKAIVMFKETAGEGAAVSVWVNPEHPKSSRTRPQ